jgi:hypothetical protein
MFELFMWQEYINNTSEKFDSLKVFFVENDTLKNGKNIYEIINTGIVSKDLLQKDLDAYRDEFSPIIERYLSKPNKSNEKSICEWLSSTNNLFMEIKRPWHNNSMSTYTNDEWNKLSIDLKKFENSFIPEYYVEIKKIADERKFYQENYYKWEEPLAIIDFSHNSQIIILDPNEKKGVKFLCREPSSTGLFLAGTYPGFEWNNANKIAGIVGGDWGISINLSSNQQEDTECYSVKKIGYEHKVLTSSSLKFSNGVGTVTHTFTPKAEYDKDMTLNTLVKFKILNDTLFEFNTKSNLWEVVYWASTNNPGFKKGLTRELKLIPGLTRTAYVIGDKNTVPGSKALGFGIGDKTKVLLMYYISNNYLAMVDAVAVLKLGDEALFKEQENKRLEQDVKKCSYCGNEYTGKTHLATYDDEKYQCGEKEVSNYKEFNKIFCTAKCALEYCRRTQY